MQKYLAALSLSAATLGVPALSFARSSAPVTRAEVRADLVRLEQAGYMPGASDNYYPRDIQTNEARIAARDERQLITNPSAASR